MRVPLTSRARALVALAALLLVPAFFLPIWTIDLEAPQYPEGIGMEIMVNTIRGQSEWDLQNINGLNHYIGMKEIHPESIRELDLMPWLLGGLVLFGLAAAATGRRRVLQAWLVAFVVLAVAGLVDFWLWGYDYGHNLNPNAAIKVPGMAYQPPVIGSKKLLNFTAHSWPGIGGIMAFAAMAAAALALWLDRRNRRNVGSGTSSAPGVTGPGPRHARVALLLLAGMAAGCEPGPVPIAYGEDVGEHCRMVIMDERYGAELVTTRGRAVKFDSIECLAGYVLAMDGSDQVHSLWVTDFHSPGELIPVDEAFFLHGGALKSPMGAGLTAFRAASITRDAAVNAYGGEPLDWQGVLEAMAEATPAPGGMADRDRHADAQGGLP